MNAFGISPAKKPSNMVMALDALHSMNVKEKLDVMRVVLDDIPADLLAEFANEAGRIAHMKQRDEQ